MSLVAHGIVAAIPMKAALKGLAHELAEYHNKDTGMCCPSVERLAKNLCCTSRQIQRGLNDLIEAGVIRREERFVEGRQTTTNYLFIATNMSPRPEPSVTPEGDASVAPGGDASVTQNQKKEPEERTNTPLSPHGGEAPVMAGVDREVWEEWLAYRRSKRKPVGKLAAKMQQKQLAELSPAEQRRAVEMSIANDWQGLFADKVKAEVVREQMPQTQDEWVEWGKANRIPYGRTETYRDYVARLRRAFKETTSHA